jgi:putative serine protease PepD
MTMHQPPWRATIEAQDGSAQKMSLSRRATALTAAGAVAILGAGAGIGAGVYSALAKSTTTTVVQSVSSGGQVQPASASSPTSVNFVYQRAHQGVVEITVVEAGSGSPFDLTGGQAQAVGSGWVYDSKGDIVTNQHVVAGASSIRVQLWNGKS